MQQRLSAVYKQHCVSLCIKAFVMLQCSRVKIAYLLLEQSSNASRAPQFTSGKQRSERVSGIWEVMGFLSSVYFALLNWRFAPCSDFSWGNLVLCILGEPGVEHLGLPWWHASETNIPCWSEINYSLSLHGAWVMRSALEDAREERKEFYRLCWFGVVSCTKTDSWLCEKHLIN